jgi:hypothetical protein
MGARHRRDRGFAGSRRRRGRHYAFPERKDGQLFEPHRHLLVKTLLEVGVPLERELVAADGSKVTLARLSDHIRRAATLPESEAEWHHAAWLLSALTLEQKIAPANTTKTPGISLAALADAALTRLELDHRVVTSFQGPASRAFDPGTPLVRAKQGKTGIYGHGCGGLHFVQAVVASTAAEAAPDEMRRLARQLGVLAFRYEAEREAYRRLLGEHPEHGLVLRTQQLKFFGHLVETLMLARSAGAYRIDSEGGRKLDLLVRQAAADVVDVVGELERGGVFLRLPAVRAEREQTYLDLVGDGCHAIRRLREALALYGE